MSHRFFIVLSLFCLTSSLFANTLKIASYNVENLFDTVHDPGKNDWAFLPKGTEGKKEACAKITNEKYRLACEQADWTKDKLDLKLAQIKKAMLFNFQALPDILGLVEVENENVLKMLAETLGYSHYLISNSPDKRGIDVAVLYNETDKLKYVDHEEIEITGHKSFETKPTRNILDIRFRFAEADLSILVNHWPSQAGPAELRVHVAKILKKYVSLKKSMKEERHFVVMGDFNVNSQDFPHPFHTVMYAGENAFLDIDHLYRSLDQITSDEKLTQPLGTYFYAPKMSWDILDRFFISKNLVDQKGLEANISSYKIHSSGISTDFLYTKQGHNLGTKIVGTPKPYNFNEVDVEKVGYSDHFPISLELTFPAKK